MKYRAAELEQAFAEHLRAVSEALARAGAEYMLIGGLAVGVWVEPRATKAADLSVRVLAPVDTLKVALANAGLEVVRGDLTWAVERGEGDRRTSPTRTSCTKFTARRSMSRGCDVGAVTSVRRRGSRR